MPPQTPLVSVVMPCLNEARTVGVCIRAASDAFARARTSGEMIVCDNGSTDGSPEIARAQGAIVVSEPQRGYGSAIRRGIAAARAPYLIMGDADASYDFADVPRFTAALQEGYDFVMATRLGGTIMPGAMPALHRYFGVPALTIMLNLLFGTRFSDAHCGLRAFTRASYDRMRLASTGMEFSSEMIIRAKQLGLRMTEIPITYYPAGRAGRSHLRSFRDGTRHAWLMVRVRLPL